MEAIRCKSSSQVSSQVMIAFQLLIVFLAVAASKKDPLNNYMAMDMGTHEYCVKLVMACEKLRDKVEKYTDYDDNELDQDVLEDTLAKYKSTGCLPEGLSQSGLREFYYLVAKWESDVNKLFLHQNLFGVVQENDGGRKIRVNFGHKPGWCPLYDDIEDTTLPGETTSSEESPEESSTFNPHLLTRNTNMLNGSTKDYCNASSTVNLWVHNEINGTLNMNSLTERFVDFNKLLKKYSSHNCCPDESIRDRMEMINDGIDILEDLQDLKPSEKKDNTDIESDYRNLNRRLEHLRNGQANYSSGKCCPAFLDHLKSYQNQFQSNLTDISPQKSNINLKDLLKKATALEDACSQQQIQFKKSFPNINNSYNIKNNTNTDNTSCCVEETRKINLIESSLQDLKFNKFQQDFPGKINSLREYLAKTNTTLSDVENLLGSEGKQIEKLKTECGKLSRIEGRTTLIESLRSNVSKLVNKLNDMGFIRTADISKLNKSSKPVNKMAKMDFNAGFKNKSEKCMQDIENLKKTFKEVSLRNNKSQDFHERYQPAAKEILETHRKRLDDLNESVKAIEASSKGHRGNSSIPTPDINKLEKDLVNLSEIAIPKLALDIIKSRKGNAGKSKENKKHLALFNEEIKRKKEQILERLDKLYNNKNMPDKQTDDSEKMHQLEELIAQLSDRHASLAKRIADRNEFLKTSVYELSKRIVKASSEAISCRSACKLGDLPTVDVLAKRVKALEAQLKNYLKKKRKN